MSRSCSKCGALLKWWQLWHSCKKVIVKERPVRDPEQDRKRELWERKNLPYGM